MIETDENEYASMIREYVGLQRLIKEKYFSTNIQR